MFTSGRATVPNLILCCGSRDWKNGRSIVARLSEEPDGTTVIEGGAYGADRLARFAALAFGFKVITVEAEWKRFGHGAGPMRNRKMLDMNPLKVIAFHDEISKSRGTLDCINEAISRNIPVELINE